MKVDKPVVSVQSSISNGTLSLKATGFTLTPSNASFPVIAPNGVVKWYQAYQQPDGSWTATADIGTDFGVYGTYSAQLFATFGGQTSLFASTEFIVNSGFGYAIMGKTSKTVEQMSEAFLNTNVFPAIYTQYGASSILEFCQIIYEESVIEGVKAEVVFAQAMKETGWLRFGGQVQAYQCNFCGLGAVNGGAGGADFSSYGSNGVRIGIRAQVQHLKAYASAAPLNQQCVDPRFDYVTRGSAPMLQNLDGKWAVPGIGYGDGIVSIINRI